MWNALSLLLGFPPGILFVFFRSSGATPLSLWSPVPFGTSHVRHSSSSPWPQLIELASSKLSLLRSLRPLGVTSSFRICRSSTPSQNPPLIFYLVHSVSGLCTILLAPYRVSCPYALCMHFRFTCVVLPPFLLVRGRSLFLLVLLLALCPRMRLASFSAVSFPSPSLLLQLLHLPLLALTAFVLSLLLLPFLVMFLSLLFLLLRLGALLLSLLLLFM